MEMVMIAGIVMVAAFLAVVLRQHRPEQALAVSILAGVAVLTLALTQALPLLHSLRGLLEITSLPGEYGVVLFKALGICLLTQLTADTCRDAGENGLAAKAELAGKVVLLLLSLPLFEKIAELAANLIRGQAG